MRCYAHAGEVARAWSEKHAISEKDGTQSLPILIRQPPGRTCGVVGSNLGTHRRKRRSARYVCKLRIQTALAAWMIGILAPDICLMRVVWRLGVARRGSEYRWGVWASFGKL